MPSGTTRWRPLPTSSSITAPQAVSWRWLAVSSAARQIRSLQRTGGIPEVTDLDVDDMNSREMERHQDDLPPVRSEATLWRCEPSVHDSQTSTTAGRPSRHNRAALSALIAVLSLSVPLAASAEAPESGESSWTRVGARPGQGERCLVCGQAIFDKPLVEIRYRGRIFHVASGEMMERFSRDPESYLHRVQARSVLFDEASLATVPLASGWLLVGAYLLLGLFFAAACSYLAIQRARPPVPWFLAGLLGNVAALVVLLSTPRGDPALPIPSGLSKAPTTRAPLACEHCGAPNHPAARTCSSCETVLSPSLHAESDRI